MALSLEDLERLRPYFKPRIKQAVTKFFLYHDGLDPATLAANQLEYVRANIPNVDGLAEQLTHYMMSEPGFIADGTGGLSDQDVSNRVEAVLLANFIPAAT